MTFGHAGCGGELFLRGGGEGQQFGCLYLVGHRQAALSSAQRTGSHTSFAAIAKEAGVSRSRLYTQQDLVTAIRQLQNRQPPSQRTGSQPASIASIQRRLDTALRRIKQLRTENSDLAARPEMAYGEIRRLRGLSRSGGLEPERHRNQEESAVWRHIG
ncbi:hypothetical protein OIE71_29285 [Streptomyces sp. NBC_01725]|uniref:hypothetical protein n=1 Tax=Streptomyces sp. NBC_01725 TaxID=2975923 RepID=UPI002E2D3F8D|nr:hypothetical protein [Streptomyces sp. NBC_01725]